MRPEWSYNVPIVMSKSTKYMIDHFYISSLDPTLSSWFSRVSYFPRFLSFGVRASHHMAARWSSTTFFLANAMFQCSPPWQARNSSQWRWPIWFDPWTSRPLNEGKEERIELVDSVATRQKDTKEICKWSLDWLKYHILVSICYRKETRFCGIILNMR